MPKNLLNASRKISQTLQLAWRTQNVVSISKTDGIFRLLSYQVPRNSQRNTNQYFRWGLVSAASCSLVVAVELYLSRRGNPTHLDSAEAAVSPDDLKKAPAPGTSEGLPLYTRFDSSCGIFVLVSIICHFLKTHTGTVQPNGPAIGPTLLGTTSPKSAYGSRTRRCVSPVQSPIMLTDDRPSR